MGSRSRKRRRDAFGNPAPAPPREPRVRGEARNEQIRSGLAPLAPGERPTAVTVGAAVAAVLGLANLVLLAVGYDLPGSDDTNVVGVLAFSALMFVAAAGMWRSRYWAVLGFQCLLALACVIAGVSLLVASNLQAVVLCLALLGSAGTLFWFLIRAMARIQMPERPGSVRRHG